MAKATVTQGLWKDVLAQLRKTLAPDIYDNWFAFIEAVTDERGMLEIRAPSEFARIWLEENYLDLIRETATRLAGEEVMVRVTARDQEWVPVPDGRELEESATRRREAADAGAGRERNGAAAHDLSEPAQHLRKFCRRAEQPVGACGGHGGGGRPRHRLQSPVHLW